MFRWAAVRKFVRGFRVRSLDPVQNAETEASQLGCPAAGPADKGEVGVSRCKWAMSVAYFCTYDGLQGLVDTIDGTNGAKQVALKGADQLLIPHLTHLHWPNLFADQAAPSQTGSRMEEMASDLYMSTEMRATLAAKGVRLLDIGADLSAVRAWQSEIAGL